MEYAEQQPHEVSDIWSRSSLNHETVRNICTSLYIFVSWLHIRIVKRIQLKHYLHRIY